MLRGTMFERFTEHARQVVVLAEEEARLMRHGHIGTEQCDPWPSIHNLLNFPRQLFDIGGPLDFRKGDIARWLHRNAVLA